MVCKRGGETWAIAGRFEDKDERTKQAYGVLVSRGGDIGAALTYAAGILAEEYGF